MRARALVSAAILLWAGTATAESTKTTPAEGITHIHRWNVFVRSAKQDYHVLLVDLANPSLRFAVSKQADKKHRPSWFGTTYGAHVAVNGSMHDTTSFAACGATQSNGAFWTGGFGGCTSSIAFGSGGKVAIFDNASKLAGPWPSAIASWAKDGLSGRPWLVRDGKPTGPWTAPASINTRRARTAVGLTATSKTLILLVVAGGKPGVAEGMTGSDLVLVFGEFLAHDALYVDGTASTSLWIGKEGGVQTAGEGGPEREVANALMILPSVAPPADAGVDGGDAGDAATDDADASAIDATTLEVATDGGYEGGPEDPTGDAGEPADGAIYEGPSEGLPTGLPPSPLGDNSGCACRSGASSARFSVAPLLALAVLLRRRLRGTATRDRA